MTIEQLQLQKNRWCQASPLRVVPLLSNLARGVFCVFLLQLLVGCASNNLKGKIIDHYWYVPPVGEVTCQIPGGTDHGQIHEFVRRHGTTVFLIDPEVQGFRLDIHKHTGEQPESNQELVERLKSHFHGIEWPSIRSNVSGGQLVDEKPVLINGHQAYYGLLYYPEVEFSLFNIFNARPAAYSAVMVTLKGNYFYSIVTAQSIWNGHADDPLREQFDYALKKAKYYFGQCEIGVARQPRPICHNSGMAIKPTIKVWPVYPEEAIKQCIEGELIVRSEVDYSGKPHRLQIVGGDQPGVFDEAVRAALQEWHFLPLCDHNNKNQRVFRQAFNFSLTEQQRAACLSLESNQPDQ